MIFDNLDITNLVINTSSFLSFSAMLFLGYKLGEANSEFTLEEKFAKGESSFIAPSVCQMVYDYNLDMYNIDSNSYREYVFLFLGVVCTNPDFRDFDLSCFYNNINDLTITKLFNFGNTRICGVYNPVLNVMKLEERKRSKLFTFIHELLHMSSSYVSNGIIYSGFCQSYNTNKHHEIGRGINEGYTQLLTRKYFGDRDNSYTVEIFIADRLCEIIGIDKMMDLYSKGNLSGLIEEISSFSSKKEATKFIVDVDFINKYIGKLKNNKTEANCISNKLMDISKTLVKCFNEKLNNDHSLGLITQSEKNEKLNEFITKFTQFSFEKCKNFYTFYGNNQDKYIASVLEYKKKDNQKKLIR